MKTKIKPIVSWSIWAIGLSLVMGLVTRHYILDGFKADQTGMSFVIALLFVFGLAASFRAAKQIHTEWGVLDKVTRTNKIPKGNGKSGLADVFNKLADYKRQGQTVDIHAAMETYHAGHNSQVRSISIMAALLISMGLLGTIVGLIMAISGLGGMVENIGLSRVTMMDALKTTVAGMGTAFYTTFFGALGGLILRAVAVSQLNSLSVLCAAASEYADSHLVANLESKEDELNQKVSTVVDSFENMRVEIDSLTQRIAASIEATMTNFGESLGSAGKRAAETTEEYVSGMTEEMGKAFGGLNDAIELSGSGVTVAFAGLNDSVGQAGETVAGSLSDFKLAVDNTSTELNDAVGELHTTISQATGEMISLAQAKFDTEATEIAGQLALASNALHSFVANKKAPEAAERVA